jgi:hypothetical protein
MHFLHSFVFSYLKKKNGCVVKMLNVYLMRTFCTPNCSEFRKRNCQEGGLTSMFIVHLFFEPSAEIVVSDGNICISPSRHHQTNTLMILFSNV